MKVSLSWSSSVFAWCPNFSASFAERSTHLWFNSRLGCFLFRSLVSFVDCALHTVAENQSALLFESLLLPWRTSIWIICARTVNNVALLLLHVSPRGCITHTHLGAQLLWSHTDPDPWKRMEDKHRIILTACWHSWLVHSATETRAKTRCEQPVGTKEVLAVDVVSSDNTDLSAQTLPWKIFLHAHIGLIMNSPDL